MIFCHLFSSPEIIDSVTGMGNMYKLDDMLVYANISAAVEFSLLVCCHLLCITGINVQMLEVFIL